MKRSSGVVKSVNQYAPPPLREGTFSTMLDIYNWNRKHKMLEVAKTRQMLLLHNTIYSVTMKLQIRTQDVTKWCKLTAKKKVMNIVPCMNRPFHRVNGVTPCLKKNSNETIILVISPIQFI